MVINFIKRIFYVTFLIIIIFLFFLLQKDQQENEFSMKNNDHLELNSQFETQSLLIKPPKEVNILEMNSPSSSIAGSPNLTYSSGNVDIFAEHNIKPTLNIPPPIPESSMSKSFYGSRLSSGKNRK